MNMKIEEYTKLKDELLFVQRLIPMNFVALDCSSFNDNLVQIVKSLIAAIVDGQVAKNKELNLA